MADLTDPDEAAATVQAAATAHGLHIVVNNAGMASVGMVDPTAEAGDLAVMPLRSWHDGLARNLDTAFLVTRAAIPHMRAAGWGRIVMVASVTGPVMAMRSEPVYAAAKAGHGRAHARPGRGSRSRRHHRERRGPRLDRDRLAAAPRGA